MLATVLDPTTWRRRLPQSPKEYAMTIAPAADPVAAGSFPVSHLAFARAWAVVAPGGWGLTVNNATAGELVIVFPPGCEMAVFFLSAEDGVVKTVRLRPAELGGEMVDAGCHATLVEALLALCPLSSEQVGGVWSEVQQEGVAAHLLRS
jgi:hypothetical protein